MPRYAAPIAPDDIKPKLVAFLGPRMIADEICEQEDLDGWKDDDTIIHGLQECAAKVTADLKKIDFSLENLTMDPKAPFGTFTAEQAVEWLGTQVFGDVTVIGCMGGGDWEEPVCFVIYYDGKAFRGYVPTQGNSFDLVSRAAIGTAPAGTVARPFDVVAMKADVMERITLRP